MDHPLNLRIVLPTRIVLDQPVRKIVADGSHGSFALLPRHVDLLAKLVPGLLAYETGEGIEEFLAVDEGVLVKCGDQVRIATVNAVRGPSLGQLQRQVDEMTHRRARREEMARMAQHRIEADLLRRFGDLERHG